MKDLPGVYELFDRLSDGVCLAEANGDILYMNPAARRLLELPKREGAHLNACELVCARLKLHSGKDAKAVCPLLDPENPTHAVTFRGQHGPRAHYNWRDDRVRRTDAWRDVAVRCLRASLPLDGRDKDEVHVVLIEDVSQEAELKRHREDWRSMIAHDLRQPLANILSALKLLQEIHPAARGKTPPGDETFLVDSSLRSCRRMMELLDLYLDVARLDASSMPVSLKPVALEGLLDDVVDLAALAANEAGVTLELDIPTDLAVVADPELLTRVVANLLDNAIKYNVKGGAVRVTAARAGDLVEVAFKDTGRGISNDDLPFIFDRYYQARARREGRLKGNGLGLTFVKQALDAMNGAVRVDSKVAEGSEFVIALKGARLPDPAGRSEGSLRRPAAGGAT